MPFSSDDLLLVDDVLRARGLPPLEARTQNDAHAMAIKILAEVVTCELWHDRDGPHEVTLRTCDMLDMLEEGVVRGGFV